jgi:hypothetical protein
MRRRQAIWRTFRAGARGTGCFATWRRVLEELQMLIQLVTTASSLCTSYEGPQNGLEAIRAEFWRSLSRSRSSGKSERRETGLGGTRHSVAPHITVVTFLHIFRRARRVYRLAQDVGVHICRNCKGTNGLLRREGNFEDARCFKALLGIL